MLPTRRVGAPSYGQAQGGRHTPLCRPHGFGSDYVEHPIEHGLLSTTVSPNA
jgi:hypothetical protein